MNELAATGTPHLGSENARRLSSAGAWLWLVSFACLLEAATSVFPQTTRVAQFCSLILPVNSTQAMLREALGHWAFHV